jgi:hypothetical protein
MSNAKITKKDYALCLIISPTIFITIVSILLMNLHFPTDMIFYLTVNSFDFTLGNIAYSQQITNQIIVNSITIDHFDEISLNPTQLEVADPSQYRFEDDSFPDNAWTSIPVSLGGVRIIHSDPTASYDLTIEGTEPMTLDRIWVTSGAKVTLAKLGRKINKLSVTIKGQESKLVLTPLETFEIITTNSRIKGINYMPYKADSMTYRVRLADHSPLITITSNKVKPYSLFLNIEISAQQNLNQVFARRKIPIEMISFSKQDSMGNLESTLLRTKDATVSYPGYPQIENKIISYSELLSLRGLREFFIEKIYLDSGSDGIVLLLRGVPEKARAGKTELRLTCFQSLWYNLQLTALFGIITWILPTSVGIYKFLKRKS